ncbi:sulfotransferase domain-containing protein [Roseovarius salinarum]|uniref:sulfotransferase domain-containing protein n=1 Tax=Roseovarius salinarum TaxID=1981892 RepID=UPI000C32C1BF|nr:sulfotransferase domain-containing protein [Roseovarius salinarum]
MKKSIVWLASYPKSGNTWVRIFLANYLMNPDKPVPINQVHRFGIGDSIAKTYRQVAGREIDYNDPNTVLPLRDRVLRGIVGNNADVNLVKTHNIRDTAFGVDLVPKKYTRSAIYILRNPLDMVLSYARHHGLTLEQTVEAIGRNDNATQGVGEAVITFLGTWSEHVDSWTRPASYPQMVVRYEDLLEDPETHFAKVVEHLGVPVQQERLKRAIRFSSFEELSEQEKKSGFVEKSRQADRFFASGKSGQWREKLPQDLADKVMRDHERVMKQYGYL